MDIGCISRVAPGDTACAGSGRNAPRRHTRLVILSIAIKPKESAAKLKDVGGLTQWSLSLRITTRATGRVLAGPLAGAMGPPYLPTALCIATGCAGVAYPVNRPVGFGSIRGVHAGKANSAPITATFGQSSTVETRGGRHIETLFYKLIGLRSRPRSGPPLTSAQSRPGRVAKYTTAAPAATISASSIRPLRVWPI